MTERDMPNSIDSKESVIDHALANGLPITRFGTIGDQEEFVVLAFGTSSEHEPIKSN